MATLLCALYAVLCLPVFPASASNVKAEGSGQSAGRATVGTENQPVDKKAFRGQQKEVIREGKLIIVRKSFAEAVRKDNTILLRTVAIKSVVSQNGQLQGFQLFQLDRGSVVEQMGFKAKDILSGVNGIPARELETKRQSLEDAQSFDVTILRNGKQKAIRIVIR